MLTADDSLVLRPPRSTLRTMLVSAVVITAVGTAGLWLKGGWQVALGGAVLLLGVVAVGAVHMARSSVVLTPHEIVVTGLGRPRRRARARAAVVVRATLIAPRGGPHHNLFVLDAFGRVLIRVYGMHYAPRDLDRLVHALGLPVSGPDRPVTAKELARRYPGILSWAEQHPYVLGGALAGAVVLLLLLGVILVTVATQPY